MISKYMQNAQEGPRTQRNTRHIIGSWRGVVCTAILLWVAVAAGCASSGGQGNAPGLMGLDSLPAEAVWADWTPVARGEQGLLPQEFIDEVVAFDYWQIDAAPTEEDGWSGAASILDYLRRESSNGDGLNAKQRATATLLLQALDGAEPGSATDTTATTDNAPGKRQMDVSFVVSLDPEKAEEGLIVRFYAPIAAKGATPGLAIYLGRTEGQSSDFERAIIWARPGFEQAEAFTIALNKDDTSAGATSPGEPAWSAQQFDGIVAPRAAAQSGSLEDVAGLAESIFKRQFWALLTGAGYVEATARAAQEHALPDDIKPALGLTLRERQIEEIYRDTVFVPQAEVPAQFR